MNVTQFRKLLYDAVIEQGLTPTNIEINPTHRDIDNTGSAKIYVQESDKDRLMEVRKNLRNFAPIERPYFISVLEDRNENEPLKL